MAEKELEGFDWQIDNAGRLLTAEVKATFYDLLLAEKKIELAERSVALNKQLLEVTKQRLEAGDIPELEMNLARVEVARSEGRKIEAERELFPAKARLLALLGLPPNGEVRFSESCGSEAFFEESRGTEKQCAGKTSRYQGAGSRKSEKRRRNRPGTGRENSQRHGGDRLPA